MQDVIEIGQSINTIRFRLYVKLRRDEGKTQVSRTKKNGQIGLMHSHNLNCMVIKWLWVSGVL